MKFQLYTDKSMHAIPHHLRQTLTATTALYASVRQLIVQHSRSSRI